MASARKFKQPKIVQPGNRRSGWYLFTLLLVLVLIAVSWYLSDYGQKNVFFFNAPAEKIKVRELEQQVIRLEQMVKALESERGKLREEVAALERASQIDREAARVVGEEIKQAQEERLKLEEELLFLRSIVSNKGNKQGLRIQDFRLESTENSDVFKYSFTVSRILNDQADVKGSILITLNGTYQGKKKSLTLAALTESKSESLAMKFRHFQKLEGLLRLPEAYSAKEIIVEVKPADKKLPRLTETFKWSVGG